MPCTDEYIDYVLEQLRPAGEVGVRKMFGDFGLYLDGKIIGLNCDNQVFIKKTVAGMRLLGEDAREGCAYAGAKPSFVFENLQDQGFICQVLKETWEELPFPKAKKPKK